MPRDPRRRSAEEGQGGEGGRACLQWAWAEAASGDVSVEEGGAGVEW